MKQIRKKHGAAFKAKVALAAIKGDRKSSSWRARMGLIPTRFTPGRSRCWTARLVFSRAARHRRTRPGRRRSIFSTGRSAS